MQTTSRKSILRQPAGQALVEFAIVLPLLLLLLFGIIEFGRALFQKNMTINAARDAVRFAVVQPSWTSGTNSTIQASITTRAKDSITMASAKTDATVIVNPPSSFTNISTVTVTVTTKFISVLPFIPLPKDANNDTLIVGSATMRYEK